MCATSKSVLSNFGFLCHLYEEKPDSKINLYKKQPEVTIKPSPWRFFQPLGKSQGQSFPVFFCVFVTRGRHLLRGVTRGGTWLRPAWLVCYSLLSDTSVTSIDINSMNR